MSVRPISEIDFGQPEAEHDSVAIKQAFYEAESWKLVSSRQGLPFVIGRKGSGKSAIAARLEFISKETHAYCFIRFVASDFRHVEIRDLLATLVNKGASWQYIYRKVWEGIILGQIVKHFIECKTSHTSQNLIPELKKEIDRFCNQCGFYVNALSDALSEVITKYVSDTSKKTDALSQVELRKMLEPYDWKSLHSAIHKQYQQSNPSLQGILIAIDGLDEHWDTSDPSLFFLAELLAVTKTFTAKFDDSILFTICLRDNIFRALVDTKSIEYDKIESLIINLQWDTQSLFKLIARRVSPKKSVASALSDLRELIPYSINDISIDEYLATYILQRPRDYINFFRMLQKECGHAPVAGEGHIEDALARYCANRLTDLENEFGSIYPGITKCISALHALPITFTKEKLLEDLGTLIAQPSFRSDAAELVSHYGQPQTIARILLSTGVIGTHNEELNTLRFVHEFSESRVTALWDSASSLGFHPVYRQQRPSPTTSRPVSQPNLPAIVTHPADYLAEKDSLEDLKPYSVITSRKRADLIASLSAIDRGQPHFRRFEEWVKDVMSHCFIGDLLNAEEQIEVVGGNKRFEIMFDIMGASLPWPEIKGKYETHRLLVECKNTDDPTDADFSKLHRDMQSLDVHVAFLVYRGTSREPKGNTLKYQRGIYINSQKRDVIVTLSEIFLLQSLQKKTKEKWRNNLNTLWRDHLEKWLPT